MNTALCVSQQCALAVRKAKIPGNFNKTGQQDNGNDYFPLCCTSEVTSRTVSPVLTSFPSQYETDINKLRATDIVRWLEDISYKERLRQLSL